MKIDDPDLLDNRWELVKVAEEGKAACMAMLVDLVKHTSDLHELSKRSSTLSRLQNMVFAMEQIGDEFHIRWRDTVTPSEQLFLWSHFVAELINGHVVTEIGRCRVDILK